MELPGGRWHGVRPGERLRERRGVHKRSEDMSRSTVVTTAKRIQVTSNLLYQMSPSHPCLISEWTSNHGNYPPER